MKFFTVLFFLFLFSGTSFAKDNIVALAEEEGSKIGYQSEILGILKQESKNGLWLKDNGNSYGVMQITIPTARFVMEKKLHMKKMTDSQIKRELISNNRLNIQIGCVYFKYLMDCLKDRDLAILSYNVGIGNVKKHGKKFDPYNYLNNVKRHMKDRSFLQNDPRKNSNCKKI